MKYAALKRFLINCKYIENLLTIDFFCGGFPSILPLEVLKNNCGFEVKRIVSFRNKDDGWKAVGYRYKFQLEDIEGNIHSFTDNNIVSKAFISHLTNRESCLNCSFATASRCSDITIGDYWGCKNYTKQGKMAFRLLLYIIILWLMF